MELAFNLRPLETSHSAQLHDRAVRTAPGGVQGAARYWTPYPLYFVRSDGGHLWDVDGHEFVDLWAAAGPIFLGHNDPRVIEPVMRSIAEHGVLFSLPHEREVSLAEEICELVPSAERVVYGCGGSDVCHFALRAARAYTDRPKYVKCEGAYHGWTDPLLVSVHPELTESGPADAPRSIASSAGIAASAVDDCLVVPFNDADALERVVHEHPGQVAAVFMEPVLHTPGCVLPAPGYLQAVREICSAAGVVLVFDEIITGFRHHIGGFQSIVGVTPDLTLLGKAMSNGFPISALAGKAEVMSTLAPLGDAYYSGTFMGQPLLVEAAIHTLAVLKKGDIYEHVYSLGDYLEGRVRGTIAKNGLNVCFEHYGSVWSLYFGTRSVSNYRDVAQTGHPLDEATQAFRGHLRNRGFYFHPATTRAYLMGAHTQDEIERLADAIDEFLMDNRSLLAPQPLQ